MGKLKKVRLFCSSFFHWLCIRCFGRRRYFEEGVVPPKSAKVPSSVGVHLHAFHLDLVPKALEQVCKIPCEIHLYVTTDGERKVEKLKKLLDNCSEIEKVHIKNTDNRGRDIGPWLSLGYEVQERHPVWCHLHTKKSSHLVLSGALWRKYLYHNLLGDENHIASILGMFSSRHDLGLVFPPMFIGVASSKNMGWGVDDFSALGEQFPFMSTSIPKNPGPFPAGTMLWYRPQALRDLFLLPLERDLGRNVTELDGTWLHLLERAIPTIARARGYHSERVLRRCEKSWLSRIGGCC